MAGPSGKPQRAASAGSVPQQQPQQHQLPPPSPPPPPQQQPLQPPQQPPQQELQPPQQQQQQQLTQRIVLAIRKFYGLSAEALQQLEPLWDVEEAQRALMGAPEVRYSLAWQEQFALWNAGLLGRQRLRVILAREANPLLSFVPPEYRAIPLDLQFVQAVMVPLILPEGHPGHWHECCFYLHAGGLLTLRLPLRSIGGRALSKLPDPSARAILCLSLTAGASDVLELLWLTDSAVRQAEARASLKRTAPQQQLAAPAAQQQHLAVPSLPAAAQLMVPSPAAQHGPASVGQPQAFALSPGLQQDLDALSSTKQQQPLFPALEAPRQQAAPSTAKQQAVAALPAATLNTDVVVGTAAGGAQRLAAANLSCDAPSFEPGISVPWRSKRWSASLTLSPAGGKAAADRQQGPAASAQTDAMPAATASSVQSWADRLRSSAAASSPTAASATLQLPQPATPYAQRRGHKVYNMRKRRDNRESDGVSNVQGHRSNSKSR